MMDTGLDLKKINRRDAEGAKILIFEGKTLRSPHLCGETIVE